LERLIHPGLWAGTAVNAGRIFDAMEMATGGSESDPKTAFPQAEADRRRTPSDFLDLFQV